MSLRTAAVPPIGQNYPNPKVSKKNKQYSLRECSIQKRKETEKNKNQPKKRGPKPRPKSLPMSKYRRKTANLRERMRMGEINVAFENLRQKLFNPMQMAKGKCEKLTKINILHVAINYIRAMENLLATGDSKVTSFSEMTKNPLRDESESKLEMQKILAALMKKAEAKAAMDEMKKEAEMSSKPPSRAKKPSKKAVETFSESIAIIPSGIKAECNSHHDGLNEWNPVPVFPVTPPEKENPMKSDKKIFVSPFHQTVSNVSSPSGSSQSFVTFGTSDLTIDTMDSLFNIDPTLNMFEQSGDDFMKDLFVDIAEIVKTLPEIEFEDNLEMFL